MLLLKASVFELGPDLNLSLSFGRSTHWWDDIVLHTFSSQVWLENFRMSRTTFMYLCRQLSPTIRRADTVMRRSISVEKRVAITLWCLATQVEYRTIAHLFGVARSTVCEIVHETCSAIVTRLMDTYIRFPTGDQLDSVVDGFLTKWGVPNCVGAIDGSHIPIAAPINNHTDYYNRKGHYSMVLQGLVDAKYCFLDVCIGWPGSVHDARVFVHSPLYVRITEKKLLPNKVLRVHGVDVPLFIIGDSAYPLQSWLMKPFPHNGVLSNDQKTYNYRLSRARIVVENAFGRLKARWRRLMKRNDMQTHHIPDVIATACILHNMCEVHGERFNDAWLQAMAQSGGDSIDPSTSVCRDGRSERPKQVRDALVHYFASQ